MVLSHKSKLGIYKISLTPEVSFFLTFLDSCAIKLAQNKAKAAHFMCARGLKSREAFFSATIDR